MERTLMIIKPDAVENGNSGEILAMIQKSGLHVLCMKMIALDRATAGRFYEVHKARPFYNSLVDYMTSGPVVVVALEGDNAVNKYREIIGATDPTKAAEGTVRKLFGESIERNAVHGSDSVENGLKETAFFFGTAELEMTNK